MPRLSKLDRSIAGRTACVTGAASGIGRATAHLFADEGARVAVVDRVADGVAAVVQQIAVAGGQAVGFVADLADPAEIDRLVREVTTRFGALDILVNNAGVTGVAAVDSEEWRREWDRNLAVNLTAPALLVRGFLPWLKAKGQGRVVNIASTEGLGASYAMTPYTASKHGVVGLTRSLAVELGHQGVNVNCICPGPINTGMTAPIPNEAKARFARRKVPLQRYAEPEEVAQGILSLVLPASSYINGVVLPVDGGMTAKTDLGISKLL
ncbi:MAG: SDR family oxidoreductase [Deltaproteobacteria bacterium]|nr:SDR family oxidoreductase [Deltaproteobacteria bacterium]